MKTSNGWHKKGSIWFAVVALTIPLVILIGLLLLAAEMERKISSIDKALANERSRVFIGEDLVIGIEGLEKDLFRMASSQNEKRLLKTKQKINERITKLSKTLEVLERGGEVSRDLLMNSSEGETLKRTAKYNPNNNGSAIMEVIEIKPLLLKIGEKVEELESLLRAEQASMETGRDFRRHHDEVASFMKKSQSLFERLTENTNRLFRDGEVRLVQLESDSMHEKIRLRITQSAALGSVFFLILLMGWIYISKSRVEAAKEKKNVEELQKAYDSLEDALSEARRAKDEAGRHLVTAEDLRVKAESASKAKSMFLSHMSHELRTPLNAIIGFSDILAMEEMSATHKSYVDLIGSSGKHLLDLVNAVLDHAKIEAGALELEYIPYSPRAIAGEAGALIEGKAQEKGIALIIKVHDDVPNIQGGDPTRIKQALLNLLSNAVKFTDEGSVTLTIEVKGKTLEFNVTDTGPGMSRETMSKLFKPFAQADSSVTRKYGGTGLGLMISKELSEAFGGSLNVKSELGSGSSFIISIPLNKMNETYVKDSKETSKNQNMNFDHLNILLVDDNRVNIKLGQAILSKMGLSPDISESGLEAIDKVKAKFYDLILMDMEMPIMGGIEASKVIRELPNGKNAAIIALTANAMKEDKEKCLVNGMDGFVSKPIVKADLLSEMEKVLRKRSDSIFLK